MYRRDLSKDGFEYLRRYLPTEWNSTAYELGDWFTSLDDEQRAALGGRQRERRIGDRLERTHEGRSLARPPERDFQALSAWRNSG
jgi:hypothetical protein